MSVPLMAPVGRAESENPPVVAVESQVFGKSELSRIQKMLGIVVGQPVDQRLLDEGIQNLYRQGRLQSLFVEAVPEGRGMRLSIRGSRIRKLRRIQFTGVDSEVLDEVRRKLNFEEGEFTDTRTFTALKEKLKSAYEARGYSFPEVEIQITDVPDSQDADVDVVVKKNSPTVVSKIAVSGASPEENAQLRNMVSLKKGGRYSKLALDESEEKIVRYLRTNQYPTAKIVDTSIVFTSDKREVEIGILVQLGSRFQFEFAGNTVFDEVTLRELLTEEILAQADAPQKIKELIENRYREVGYHFCTVDPKNVTDEMAGVNVVRFEIGEGSKVLIDRTEFSGVRGFSEETLESLFYEGAPGVLARRIYWEEGLKTAVAALQKRLETMGFLSVSLTGPRVTFTEDKKGAQLVFDVDMGVQTHIAHIELEGMTQLPRAQVAEQLSVREAEPLSRDQVDETRKNIIQYYNSQGYADARFTEGDLNESIVLSKDQREATVRLHVVEGTQYFVGQVTVEGLKKTQPHVVLREMKLKTGDKYDPQLMRRSEDDIAGLGLFSRAEILSTTSPTESNRKDLKVVVRETRPGVGEVGLGAYYEDPLLRVRSFFGIAYRNLFGLNQTASIRTELSQPLGLNPFYRFTEYGVLLGYRSPYPLEVPVTFVVEAGLARQEIAPETTTYQRTAKVEERVEKRFSKTLTVLYRLHHFENTTTTIPTSDQTIATDTIGSTGPGLILDFRDNIFNPTRGSFHTLDFEYAHPALVFYPTNPSEFIQILSRNSFYFPLFGPLSFSTFVGGGYAYSLNDQTLPISRLQYGLALGGWGSIRGFTANRFYSVNVFEAGFYNLRFELTSLLFSNISVAVFLDSGQLLHDPARHDGVGFGFRYKTPVGPVVIDIAQGLGPAKEAVKFYFTVGTF